jgi:hypothetical protein
LVRIGLNHPSWRTRIAEALAPEDVQDPILRRIFTDFVQGERAELGAEFQTGPRPTSLYPTEVQQRLASLWASGPSAGDSPGDPKDAFPVPLEGGAPDAGSEGSATGMQGTQCFGGDEGSEVLARTVEDCLSRIHQRRAVARRQALRQALEAADRGGDHDHVLRLLAEHPSVKANRDTAE